MVASRQSQPLFSSEDTLAVIRSRIDEKRLFEARFLWRKLGQGLAAEECVSLEQELGDTFKEVERLQREAREQVSRGAYASARGIYERLEALAIDVPGVAEEKKALAGAEALAARLAQSARPEKKVTETSAPVLAAPRAEEPSQVVTHAAPSLVQQVGLASRDLLRRIGQNPGMLAGGAAALLCVLALLLFFFSKGGEQGQPLEATPKPDPSMVQPTATGGEQRGRSQPLVEVEPPPPQPPPEGEAEAVRLEENTPQERTSVAVLQAVAKKPVKAPGEKPEARPVQKPAAPDKPSLNLGGLRIE